jgi:hypothetical protein
VDVSTILCKIESLMLNDKCPAAEINNLALLLSCATQNPF